MRNVFQYLMLGSLLIIAVYVVTPASFVMSQEEDSIDMTNSTKESVGQEMVKETASPTGSQFIVKSNLLDNKEIERVLFQEYTESKTHILSYIDTGFSEEVDAVGGVSDEISDINIHFYVTNPFLEDMRMTLNTGIKKGVLTDIHINGATGYRWDDNELVIAYIPLQPQGSTLVTLTAMPIISNKKIDIEISPVLKNKFGDVISTGSVESRSILPKTKTSTARFLKGIGARSEMGNQNVDSQKIDVIDSPADPNTSAVLNQLSQ